MSIRYTIVKNNSMLGGGPCLAKVRPQGSATFDQVVDLMMLTATVAKPDVLGVLESFFSAVEYLLLDGKNVLTPLAVFRTGIQGTFSDEADSFETDRHRVHASASAGARLRRVLRSRATTERVHLGQFYPVPERYYDVESGVDNDILTPGGQGRLIGDQLRFDPADPKQGVFFVAGDGSAVRAGLPARNMPREVIFVVPALAAGQYTLEVRAGWGDNGETRTGQLDEPLTVQ